MRAVHALPCLAIVAGLMAGAASGPAAASGDQAWAEFRASVEDACRALLTDMPGEATVLVNPFGSESYGAAVVSVTSAAGADRMICIYDKATGAAELTAPFGTGQSG